jgi:hypothetical protein
LRNCAIKCDLYEPFVQLKDLAPLTRLTQLAMTCVPPELPSHPLAARLRRLQLQAFGVLDDAPGGGGGSGANGAAAAALAALARGAPLLERLRIRETIDNPTSTYFVPVLESYPGDVDLGPPLGPSVAWPSLTHLEVTPWAALLLADCTFPRLSRLVATISEQGGDRSFVSNERLQTAVSTLVTKARDHAGLKVGFHDDAAGAAASMLAAVAAVQGLRHLAWKSLGAHGFAATPSCDWARLAPTLESLELSAPSLATLGYAEPLPALTCLTRLFLEAKDEGTAAAAPPEPGGARGNGGPFGGPARTARALARLPRLAHLRLAFGWSGTGCDPAWGCPEVAAALARCPALRLLEIDRPGDPLWRHEIGPARGDRPRMPRPSPAWPPFAAALRAGGCGAVVRPGPAEQSFFQFLLDVDEVP